MKEFIVKYVLFSFPLLLTALAIELFVEFSPVDQKGDVIPGLTRNL